MSELVERLFDLEACRIDAVLLQTKGPPGDNGGPAVHRGLAIIRRIHTMGGYQYAYHSLMGGATGSGMYSLDLNEICAWAERNHGVKLAVTEWIGCDYADLPANLYPR